MTKVQKPVIIYKDNQGEVFLANNRWVGICKKYIYICHYFLRGMVEDKNIDIQYILSADNPADIITNNTSEAYFVRHVKSII